jgi:ribonucleoside-diphosphate reductase alpha chain
MGVQATLTDNAMVVLQKRYLKKETEGNSAEEPEGLFRRVANNIAQGDLIYDPQAELDRTEEQFYSLLSSLDFLPNSPTLMNAGRELQQLSACFVLPVGDSLEEIFEAVKQAALIHKSGGGTGFSFSRIRPKNDRVKSTEGISSGPLSFMAVFDTATETVKQGGMRRGANMGILRVDHPDILDFIGCKEGDRQFNNFNLSVAVTEDFMGAVEDDGTYFLINPRTGQEVRSVRAREVFDRIVARAWKNGEPGVLFLDRINRDNPTPQMGEIESTNPCGEQPLLPFESCNLGSVNLSNMVQDGALDWERLERTVQAGVHFLDNVIDMNCYPLTQIESMTKGNRKIGLGVMGFADMLIKLGIPYDSAQAIEMAERVMEFIQKEARQASRNLALQRGSFPNFEGSLLEGQWDAMRNATVTTIAPTGSLSIIAGVSSGIEPIFALAFSRNVLDGTELMEVNPLLLEIAKREGFYSEELMQDIVKTGDLGNIDGVPERFQKLFVTAHQISPEYHIRMQAAFQRYTDNAVSKTVNLPHEATADDVRGVYRSAFQLGCKGVTIYRDRSRCSQVLNKDQGAGKGEISAQEREPRPRHEVTFGMTRKMKTGCGNLYVTINEDEEGHLFEIFNQMGKAGGCGASQSEAIGRLVSLALRSGIRPSSVIRQLRGISCHLPMWHQGGKILSCSDAIAKAIESYSLHRQSLAGNEPKPMIPFSKHSEEIQLRGACPDCGGPLRYEEGCAKCPCGYSDCN